MKNSLENINKRRSKIIDVLHQKGQLSIPELSQLTDVSEMTIRRDCKELIKMGEVEQDRGLISIIDRNLKTNQIDPHGHIKEKLAEAAASFVHDNYFISINSSSTAIKVIKYIKSKNTVIHTNNANVVNIDYNENCSIVLSGGELTSDNILVGNEAINSFSAARANIAIIGCAGLNVANGISTPVFREADVNRSIIRHCQKLILVADYSKIGQVSNFTIGDIDDVDVLITDNFADKKELDKLQNHGVEVIQIPI